MRVDHFDLENRVTPTRGCILAGSAYLPVLKALLKLDVRLLASVNHNLLQVVDDEIAVFFLSDIEAFSIHLTVVTV